MRCLGVSASATRTTPNRDGACYIHWPPPAQADVQAARAWCAGDARGGRTTSFACSGQHPVVGNGLIVVRPYGGVNQQTVQISDSLVLGYALNATVLLPELLVHRECVALHPPSHVPPSAAALSLFCFARRVLQTTGMTRSGSATSSMQSDG